MWYTVRVSRLRPMYVALLWLCACLDSHPRAPMVDAQQGEPPNAVDARIEAPSNVEAPSDAGGIADAGPTPASDGCPCDARCDCGDQCSTLLWPSPGTDGAQSSTCPLSLEPRCGTAVLGSLSFVDAGVDAGGDDPEVQSVSDLAECGDGHGWHNDGESSQLCPATCARLQRMPGSLRLRLPCPAILCE